MSPDGSAVVATDGSAIYLWTTAAPSFTYVDVGPGWDADVSNGGAFISASRPDPNNNDYETAARWDASTGQWTFLPTLGGVSGTSTTASYDISGDGQVVVGLAWLGPYIAHAFSWDAFNGTVDLGVLQGSPSTSRANAVSANGTTVVGWDSDPNTGVWRGAYWIQQVEALTGCLNPSEPVNGPSECYAASSNGTFIVGESNTGLFTPSFWDELHAFRWDAVNGLVDLGTTPVDPWGWGSHHTVPTGVSDDGRTVVGWAGAGFFGQQVFIWREGSPMTYLQSYLVALGVPQASAWTFADVASVSSDGRVICGTGYNPQFVAEPYRVELPPLAETYCVAKVNSLGCTPAIGASGIASVSSTLPFSVDATNVVGDRNGQLYYGFAALNAPFQGGTKCVGGTTRRTPLQSSQGTAGGVACTGTYSYDFNQHIQFSGDPMLVAGVEVFAQYWTRDPASPSTTGLTDAVRFPIFP